MERPYIRRSLPFIKTCPMFNYEDIQLRANSVDLDILSNELQELTNKHQMESVDPRKTILKQRGIKDIICSPRSKPASHNLVAALQLATSHLSGAFTRTDPGSPHAARTTEISMPLEADSLYREEYTSFQRCVYGLSLVDGECIRCARVVFGSKFSKSAMLYGSESELLIANSDSESEPDHSKIFNDDSQDEGSSCDSD